MTRHSACHHEQGRHTRLITSTSVNAHCLIPMKNAILMIPLKWLILKLINNRVYNLRIVVMSVWNMNSELNIHIVHSYDYTPLSSRAFWLWYITGEEREIRSKYSQQTGKESECWTHCRMDCAMLSLVISLISPLLSHAGARMGPPGLLVTSLVTAHPMGHCCVMCEPRDTA